MSKVIVVGDGPAGLSAALFMAKNGLDVTVFGQDETAMHYAMLYNYLGIPQITGPDFQVIARKQVASFGAELESKRVTAIERQEDGFAVSVEDGDVYQGKYVVLAEGKAAKLAKALGLAQFDKGIETSAYGRTSIEGLYVVGRATHTTRSQAIISAGQGAQTALAILSAEAGKDVNDFDTPPDDD